MCVCFFNVSHRFYIGEQFVFLNQFKGKTNSPFGRWLEKQLSDYIAESRILQVCKQRSPAIVDKVTALRQKYKIKQANKQSGNDPAVTVAGG